MLFRCVMSPLLACKCCVRTNIVGQANTRNGEGKYWLTDAKNEKERVMENKVTSRYGLEEVVIFRWCMVI